MPNWCQSKLKIKSHLGIEESLIDFSKWLGKNQSLSLEKILPTSGIANKTAWRQEHWGVKYDINRHECFVSQSVDSIEIKFITAWVPPLRGLVALSQRFPELTFELEFSEPKMNLSGSVKIKRGELGDIRDYGRVGLTGLIKLK